MPDNAIDHQLDTEHNEPIELTDDSHVVSFDNGNNLMKSPRHN